MKRLIGALLLPLVACTAPEAAPAGPPATAGPAATETFTPVPPTPSLTVAPPPTTPPNAGAFPNPDLFQWVQVAAGLNRPLDVQEPRDGSARLFILEQSGRIRILQDGVLLETPFLDIDDRVQDAGNEQGLLGLAFHPRYAENGYFYLNYTREGGDTVIARYQVSADPSLADPESEQKLIDVNQPFPNHNGGVLTFGPDGYLYLGLGDGGAGGDPFGNAQSLETLLGKVLRIDVDGDEPYAIPADNPFGSEILHYGLRNPWRLSFDCLTGGLYIGDVGQNDWEEIDFAPAGSAGLNFGWDLFEGSHTYEGGSPSGLVMPVAEYSHSQGCSVSGGYVYRGSMPEWQGIYLYGDYCSGLIWALMSSNNTWQSQVLFETDFRISSFGENAAGEIYLTDLQGGVYRLDRR